MRIKENSMIMTTPTMGEIIEIIKTAGMGKMRPNLMDLAQEIEAISKGKQKGKMMKTLSWHMTNTLRKTEHMPNRREGLMLMPILLSHCSSPSLE